MARPTKLDETHNFLELYLHHTGTSDIPAAYHKWACLSLVAALVRDNVWYEKYTDVKLTPHLFVFLIGESGTGKDVAVRVAERYLRDVKNIRPYHGRTSSAALTDLMFQIPKGASFADPRIWLITPELANSIGSGGAADAFIKFATDIFSGKDPNVPWQEHTRYAGHKQITAPMLNWFAGTTKEWLMQVINMDEIKGGFFARICPIEVETSTEARQRKPTSPWDYTAITDYLYERVELYANAEGVFTMTAEADLIDEQWFSHRPAPSDERLLPTWRRQHEMVLKIAQLYALCDWEKLDQPFTIKSRHLVAAQKDAALFLKSTANLLGFAATKNVDATAMLLVANIIKAAGSVRKSRLLKKVYSEGVSAEYLHRIIETLKQAGDVDVFKPEGVGLSAANPTYVWASRKLKLEVEPTPRGLRLVRSVHDTDPDTEEEANNG